MEESYQFLPAVYLSVLLILLGAIAVFLLRQILRTRKTEKTFSQLQEKLQKKKGTAEDYYQLAGLCLDKKLYVQGVNLLQKALKIKPIEPKNEALIYNALGYAYFIQEQYDLAIRNYKEALKLNPDYVIALNNLGNVYEKKQLTAQALEVYQQALEHDGGNKVAKRRAESLSKRIAT